MWGGIASSLSSAVTSLDQAAREVVSISLEDAEDGDEYEEEEEDYEEEDQVARKTHFLSLGMFDMRALALIAVSAACADAFVAGPALLPSTRAVSACGAPTLRMAADNSNFDLSITRRGILNAGAATAAAWTLSGLPTIAGASDWIEVEDPKDPKKSYWYNTVTQKTSATNPEGAAGASAATASADGAKTGKVSRMGGLLEPFKDINKGFQLFKPKGWNQFDAAPGEYDIKWEDLVEKSEMVMVGSNPVKTATSVKALGPIEKVGEKLAAKKKAQLVSSEERTVDGIDYYKFIFKAGNENVGAREVYQLAVNKGRLWSVTATTSEKRWAKREPFYNNIMQSFIPKL